jgi:hypothetical protein
MGGAALERRWADLDRINAECLALSSGGKRRTLPPSGGCRMTARKAIAKVESGFRRFSGARNVRGKRAI